MADTSEKLENILVHWEPLPEALTGITGFMLYWVTGLAGQFLRAGGRYRRAWKLSRSPRFNFLDIEGPMVQARLAERAAASTRRRWWGFLTVWRRRGWSSVRPYADDKRALEIHPTKAGREKAREVERVNREADRIFFAALSGEERETFHALLSKLATSRSLADTRGGEDDHTNALKRSNKVSVGAARWVFVAACWLYAAGVVLQGVLHRHGVSGGAGSVPGGSPRGGTRRRDVCHSCTSWRPLR